MFKLPYTRVIRRHAISIDDLTSEEIKFLNEVKNTNDK